MSSILSQPHFHDEEAAYAWVEKRLWPNGPKCPRCGETERVGKLEGKSTRIGVHKCYKCRKPFTVKVGTVFESSHIPLHIWLQGIHLMVASKKGFSANEYARVLGITIKSAWFMAHRIREAMKDKPIPMGRGGGGGPVEVDETFFGQNPEVKAHNRMPIRNMNAVMILVDRESGKARSVVLKDMKPDTIYAALRENLAKEANLYTDEAPHYFRPGREQASHRTVAHAQGQFYRPEDITVHTQCVEGYYSVFKRGMRGTYQHCARKHLHRYTAEFDFRYSNRSALGINDVMRSENLLQGVVGKRLTYQTTGKRSEGGEVLA